mmetsp:Transcript_28771/g.56197  ORF Transcript_28771/g.56197 Transcript_28771/m.56197 type:complete len:291 (+) Transcript_28771:1437-2309(+)
MSVDRHNLPAVRLVARGGVLGLGVLGHLVEGHVVGVVDDDKVVEALVGSKASALVRDALLEAPVTAESDGHRVKDGVVLGVEHGLLHLLGGGNASSVDDTLAEGAGGGLNAGGVVLARGELGVTGGHRVVLAEVLDLLHGDLVARDVEPRVEEHGAVSARENEAITVDPLGILGVVLEEVGEEDSADLSAAEGKAEMAGLGRGDGVHGETTGLGRDAGEGGGVLAGSNLHAERRHTLAREGRAEAHAGGGGADAGLGDEPRGRREGRGAPDGEDRHDGDLRGRHEHGDLT